MTMITLQDATRLFLLVERAVQTNRQYGFVLSAFVELTGREHPVQSVTYGDLLQYFVHLRSRAGRQTGKPLKDSTIYHHSQVLRSFYNWAVDMGYIVESPMKRLKVRRRAEDPDKIKAIPPAELEQLIHATEHEPRNHAVLLFMADTGCRVGGLVSLRLTYLDLDNRTAQLVEKGGGWHRVYFGEETARALEKWLGKRPVCNHDHVWTGKAPHYAPIKRAAVEALVRALCQRVGTSRLWTPHAIRHSVAHSLADRGVPVTIVQAKLGHSDPNITMKMYYPHDSDRLRQVSDTHALAALGKPPKGAPQ